MLSETTDRLITKQLATTDTPTFIAGNASGIYHALLNLGINAVQAIEERVPARGPPSTSTCRAPGSPPPPNRRPPPPRPQRATRRSS